MREHFVDNTGIMSDKILRLKELREANGVLQKDLAERLHKTRECISGWEREKTQPDLQSLVELANCLGCTTDALLGREDYGTGLVEVRGEMLSANETQLVRMFRTLSDKEQQKAIKIFAAFCNEK